MRILYLNTTYSGGGAERVTRQIYEGMRRRGHEVYEIVCYNRKGKVTDPNVHVLYPDTAGKILLRLQTGNRGNENLTIPYAIGYIRRFVKKHRIDLIHLHNPHDNFLGIRDIASLRKLCPVVWTLHDFWALTGHCAFPFECDERWKSGCVSCGHLSHYPRLRRDVSGRLFAQKKERLTGAGLVLTAPSDWMARQVRQSYLSEEPCEVICNSLDPDRWKSLDKQALRRKHGIDNDKLVLAFVAADLTIPQKGMRYLLDALSRLDGIKYTLLIAGNCPQEPDALKERFEVKYFGYIGEQRRMNEFYAMADILVNPSVYETFGLVNIEAMASGTPALAFRVCVMPEVVGEDGGWLVDELSGEALGRKLEELERNRNEIEQKRRSCRSYVERKYSEEQMLDQYEALYGRVCGR